MKELNRRSTAETGRQGRRWNKRVKKCFTNKEGL